MAFSARSDPRLLFTPAGGCGVKAGWVPNADCMIMLRPPVFGPDGATGW
jgi:hypothetical protein